MGMKPKKSKRNYDSTSRKAKAAGLPVLGRRKGEWELKREKTKTPGMDKVRPKGERALALKKDEMLEMARDKAGGMSDKELSKKYAISEAYVRDSLKTLYLNNKMGREILKNVLLDNAIAGGMRVRETIGELNPMQSVVATGIMTQRYIDIDKHNSQQVNDVDIDELQQVGELLRDLNKAAGLDDSIDVDAEVTKDSDEDDVTED